MNRRLTTLALILGVAVSVEGGRANPPDHAKHASDDVYVATGHGRRIVALALSPDGAWLASGDEEGLIRLWRAEALVETATLGGRLGRLRALRFSPDGRLLAATGDAASGRCVEVWDLARRQLLWSLDGAGAAIAAFDRPGRRLAVLRRVEADGPGLGGEVLRVLDAATGATLEAPEDAPRADGLAFSRDGTLLAIENGWEGLSVGAWRDGRWSHQQLEAWPRAGRPDAMEVSPDGEVALLTGPGGPSRLRSLRPGPAAGAALAVRAAYGRVAFSPDGRVVALEAEGELITIASINGRLMRNLASEEGRDALAVGPTGVVYEATGGFLGPAALCRRAEGAPVCVRSRPVPRAVEVTARGELAIGFDAGERLQIWRTRGDGEVELGQPMLSGGALATSEDGRLLAYGQGTALRLHRVSTGGTFELARDDAARYRGIALGPDGETVVAGVGPEVVAFGLDGVRRALGRHADGEVSSVRVNAAGTLVASAAGGALQLRELGTGALRGALEVGSPIVALDFAPDGAAVAIGCEDGRVRVVATASGEVERELETGAPVGSLRYAAGGLWVGSGDRALRRFDPASGAVTMTLEAKVGASRWLAPVPTNPSLLASADSDGWVRLWDVSRGHLVARITTLNNDDRAGWLAVGADGSFETSARGLPVPPGLEGRPRREGLVAAALGLPERPPEASRGGPELVPQQGHGQHGGVVQPHVTYSPDGALLASTSSSSTVLWDLRVGKQLRTLEGGAQGRFSPDGRLLAVVGGARTKIFETATGAEVAELPQGEFGSGLGLRWSADGRRLALTSFEPWTAGVRASIWDVAAAGRVEEETTPLTPPLDPRTTVSGPQLAPDGRLVAWADGRLVALFDPRGGRPPARLEGHGEEVLALAFSPDGGWLASGDATGLVMVWRTSDRDRVATLRAAPFERGAPVRALAFSRDGGLLAVAAAEISVWDLRGKAPGALRHTLYPPWRGGSGTASPHGLAFSPDGAELAVGMSSGTVERWDLATGATLHVLQGTIRAFDSALVHPRRPELVTVQGARVRVWDAALGREGRVVADLGGARSGLSRDVERLALSADGSRAAVANGAELRLVELASGATVSSWPLEVGLTALVVSPDGGRVIGTHPDGCLMVWNAIGPTSTVLTEPGPTSRLALSPDGRLLALSPERGALRLIDAATGAPRGELPAAAPRSGVTFTSDTHLAVSDDRREGAVTVWDVRNGTVARRLVGFRDEVGLVAAARGRRLLATKERSGPLVVWDPGTGRELGSLRRAPDLRTLEFSHDARYLVGVDTVGQVHWWDVDTLAPRATLAALGEDDFILWSPEDSAYLASRDAHLGVAFRSGREALPFEALDLLLNQPDRLLARLGYASKQTLGLYAAARARRVELLGAGEAMPRGNLEPPSVELLGGPPPASASGRTLRLRIRARHRSAAIGRLQVHVNDVPVHGASGLDVSSQRAREVEREVEVTLSRGANRIQLSATTTEGVESPRATFVTTLTTADGTPQLLVIGVGVSRYKDSAFDLTYASKDASDMVSHFSRSPDGETFGRIATMTLLDGQVTREALLGLRAHLAATAVDDGVILFVAGHGLLDETRRYFFATHDVDFEDPAARGVSYAELEGLLDGIPARRKLLMMDTCHAGEIDGDATRPAPSTVDGVTVVARGVRPPRPAASPSGEAGAAPPAGLVRDLFAELRRGSGAHVIAAAGGAEYAVESARWKNGLFTWSVLEGLGRDGAQARADRDDDGDIDVGELRDFVIAKVREGSGGAQTPTARRENLSAPFDLTPFPEPEWSPAMAARRLRWQRTSPLTHCPAGGDDPVTYACGAMTARIWARPGLTAAEALDAIAPRAGRSGDGKVVTVRRRTLRDGGRDTPVIEVLEAFGGRVDVTLYAAAPDARGQTQVVACLAQHQLAPVIARCERGLRALAGASPPRLWPE